MQALRRIDLSPLDPLPTFLRPPLIAHVEQLFGFPARWREIALPLERAYDPARGQFHAGTLLRMLAAFLEEETLRLVGLTGRDLYEEGLNFVFGEAEMGGRCAVVSLFRLASRDRALLIERAKKEVTHELGHTFGLGHCPDPTCVMSFSNSLLEVDRKRPTFCPRCQRQLLEALPP